MRNLLLALSLGAAFGLSGCDIEDWNSSDRFKEDFAHNYPMKPGGRLYLENFNGSVEVRGWEKDTIDITGTKYAATEDLLKELKIDISATPDTGPDPDHPSHRPARQLRRPLRHPPPQERHPRSRGEFQRQHPR